MSDPVCLNRIRTSRITAPQFVSSFVRRKPCSLSIRSAKTVRQLEDQSGFRLPKELSVAHYIRFYHPAIAISKRFQQCVRIPGRSDTHSRLSAHRALLTKTPETAASPLFRYLPATKAEFSLAYCSSYLLNGYRIPRHTMNFRNSRLAVVALVITGAATAIVNVRVAFPVPLPLVALSVTVEVAEADGVPEINPVGVFTDNPAGNPVAP